MFTAEKFDVTDAFERGEAEVYKIEKTTKGYFVAKTVDWEQEQREQEFKQALLEGRFTQQNRRQFVDFFKFKAWIR